MGWKMEEEKKSSGGLSRRNFLYLAGAGIAGMAVAQAPRPAHGDDKKPRYGGRLRVAERYGSPGLDAHRNQTFIDYQ
jgi:hypothetical protein